MHAYLIVGNNQEEVDNLVNNLIKRLKVKPLEYPLIKIKDVRELESFTNLSVDKSTGILVKNIDAASTEALNAFLKNLEEPQENITYILTANSIKDIPATIISRCQILKTRAKKKLDKKGEKEISRFIKGDETQKLRTISKIWGRNDAINFIESFVLLSHSLMIKAKNGHLSLARNMNFAKKTLENLKANGNVQLQLTNFVLGLV
jgi:DNA polymerase III delta prime subunit